MGQVYLASGRNCSNNLTIKGILVTPSGANWVSIIQDSAAKTLFSAVGADAVSRYYPVSISADAFNQQTATNITCIILYT